MGLRHSRIVEPVRRFLTAMNEELDQIHDLEKKDVISMLPKGMVEQYPNMLKFLTDANNLLGHQQAVALSKLHHFIDDRNLVDDRQSEIRLNCLHNWNLSPDPRPVITRGDVPEEVKRLLSVRIAFFSNCIFCVFNRSNWTDSVL